MELITKIRKIIETTRNAKLTPQALRNLQESKLRSIVNHAYKTTPFYKRLMDASGVSPDHIRTIEDLSKLPLVTKQDIQDHYKDIISNTVDVKDCLVKTTSGSSGKMLRMLWEPDNFWFRVTSYYRSLNMIGYTPFKKLLYFLQKPDTTGFTFGLFRNIGLEPRVPFRQVREHLLRFKPDILAIYPSHCKDLAAYLSKTDIEEIGIEAISLNSEMMFQKDKDEIETAFNCPVYEEYSSIEMGMISSMCKEKQRHLFTDSVVAEFLDSGGNPVGPGERGELVLTSLSNYAMPLIRYRLGDYSSAIEGTCNCGRPFPLTGPVEGRRDDSFILKTGDTVASWKIYEILYQPLEAYSRDKIVLSDLYLVQKQLNKAHFYYVKGPDFDGGYFEGFEAAAKKLFGDGLSISVIETDYIERVKSVKRKIIHCDLK